MACVTLGGAAVARAQTGAPGGTDASVQSLRQEADQASSAYFAALDRYQALNAQIAGIQDQLPQLRAAEAARLKTTVERAVVAYEEGGSGQLGAIMDSRDLLSVETSTEWLQVLNAGDDHALAGFKSSESRLEAEERLLQTDEASSAAALKVLDAQGQAINVELTAAVTQEQQQQQAAAAAAAGPPLGATGGGGGSASAGDGGGTGPSPNPPQGEAAFLACVKQHESGGDYQAVNPAGYYGAYQFSQATWNATANHAGRLDLINVRPDHASPADQDEMAEVLYEWQGPGPWAGDGC